MFRPIVRQALLAAVALGLAGVDVARATTIQTILDNGGSLKVGQLTFMFTNQSVGGSYAQGDYDPSKIEVEQVAGGLKFIPMPMLDLKTDMGGQSLQVTIKFKVTATRGISRVGLTFTPGQIQIGGTAEATKTLSDGADDMLRVFKTNNDERFTQKLTDAVNLANLPTSLMVEDVGRVSLSVNQGNQRTIQLLDLTNTFAVVPEPSSLVLACAAIPLGLLGHRLDRRHRARGGRP
jgi:hypothetical protein